MTLNDAAKNRLQFLARVIKREKKHLQITSERFFEIEFTEETAKQLDNNVDYSERLDAFVARFSRLQDTLGDKMLPQLLLALNESVRTQIDNLDKAERFGWIRSADEWVEIRNLRNQMIHEYIEDLTILVNAVSRANAYVKVLLGAADNMLKEIKGRGWIE